MNWVVSTVENWRSQSSLFALHCLSVVQASVHNFNCLFKNFQYPCKYSGEEWHTKRYLVFTLLYIAERDEELQKLVLWLLGFHSLCRVCPWVCNSVVTLLFPCHDYKIIACRFHRCTSFSCMACNCVSRKSHNLAS